MIVNTLLCSSSFPKYSHLWLFPTTDPISDMPNNLMLQKHASSPHVLPLLCLECPVQPLHLTHSSPFWILLRSPLSCRLPDEHHALMAASPWASGMLSSPLMLYYSTDLLLLSGTTSVIPTGS